MAMRLEFEIYGEKLISRQLLRIADRTIDFGPVWGAVSDHIRGSEQRLFDSEGASSGRPWKQIQPSTVQRKLAAGLDPRILHETLRTRRSLTEGHGTQPAEDQVLIATPSALAFGSSVPQAVYQARAGRRPVDFDESDKKHIVRQLQAYALRGTILP